jgi:hypothetical protein
MHGTESGLTDEDYILLFYWDCWEEDQYGNKRTDQGYQAMVDPSNMAFTSPEMRSLLLLYGSFSEIGRYASSAPPESFGRFATIP